MTRLQLVVAGLALVGVAVVLVKFVQPKVDAISGQMGLTEEVARLLRASQPGTKVRVSNPLALTIERADGGEPTQVNLENLWSNVQGLQPTARDAQVLSFVRATISGPVPARAENLVPVVKTAAWLAETRRVGAEPYSEPLGGDFVVAYGFDEPERLSYASRAELESLGLDAGSWRAHAMQVLHSRLPEVQRHGQAKVFMFTAGGTYETSLVLSEALLEQVAPLVDGDLVVSMPARDVLMVTGSESADVLAELREKARQISSTGAYPLSPQLLVRRDGGWSPLE